MIVLRLVNIKDKYIFYKEYSTIGEAWHFLKKLSHSHRIRCIGIMDKDSDYPLPPHLSDAYMRQYPIDNYIEYQSYPTYINIKKGD